MIQDDGRLWMTSDKIVPPLSKDVFRALLKHAHLREMRAYVHVTQLRDGEEAIAAGVN